jgi:hypothetical protein
MELDVVRFQLISSMVIIRRIAGCQGRTRRRFGLLLQESMKSCEYVGFNWPPRPAARPPRFHLRHLTTGRGDPSGSQPFNTPIMSAKDMNKFSKLLEMEGFSPTQIDALLQLVSEAITERWACFESVHQRKKDLTDESTGTA